MSAQTSRDAWAVRAAMLTLCTVTAMSSPSASLATPVPVTMTEIFSPGNENILERSVTVCDDTFCRGRSEEDRWALNDTRTHSCHCDEACGTFGDCCRDSPGVDSRPREDISCLKLKSYLGVYAVSRCPDEWPRDETRRRCEVEDTLAKDPLLGLPVTSLYTRMTYRNAACAQCHADTRDTVLWLVRVECPGVRQGQDQGQGQGRQGYDMEATLRRSDVAGWGLTLDEDGGDRFHSCSVALDMPQKLQDVVRTCLPAVSDCGGNGTDPEADALCGMYTAFAYDSGRSRVNAQQEGHVYRNPHCAVCNGVAPENITCDWSWRVGSETTHPVSLSIAINITNRKGVHDGDSVEVCPGTRLWDPFFHKCRDLFCNADQSMVEDVCIPDTVPIDWKLPFANNSDTNDVKEDPRVFPCTKYVIFADEFERMDDGGVYVIIYDHHYSPDQYEHIGRSISVCSEMDGLGNFGDVLSIISMVFVSASIVCLCCHLVVFCLVPKLRNLPGRNLASLCVTLLVEYVCFVVKPFQDVGSSGCHALAIIMYAAFIASFFWMNVMAFDVFTTLRLSATELRVSAGGRTRRFLLYFLYVSTITGALVLAAVTMDVLGDVGDPYRPGFGDRVCWFSRRKAMIAFFGVPLVAVMAANVALFCGSAFIIRRTAKASASTTSSKTNLRLYSRLALITGMSWVVGLVAGWLHFPPLWYIFVVLDTLQGVFIFVSFTLAQRVRLNIKRGLSRFSAGGKKSRTGTREDVERTEVQRIEKGTLGIAVEAERRKSF